PPTVISTLSLHDALPIFGQGDIIANALEVALQHLDLLGLADAFGQVVVLDAQAQGLNLFVGQSVAGDNDLEAVVVGRVVAAGEQDRKSTRLNSSHVKISY